MIKVLIAEDEQGILNSLANAFSWENMGCEITGLAQTGIEALELCISNPPDIIISDIVMPGIDGISLLRYIKEKYSSIQFIVLTGHRNFEYARNALNLGAAMFLLKPVNFMELEKAVKTITAKLLEDQENKQLENQQEYVLSSLLNGHIYPKNELPLKTKQLLSSLTAYRICVFQFDDNQEEDMFRIQNLALFYQQCTLSRQYIPVKINDIHFVLIITGSDAEKPDELQHFLVQFQSRIYHFFHTTISIGISSMKNGYEMLHTAYTESTRALSKQFFSGNQSIHFFLSDSTEEDLYVTNRHAPFRYLEKIQDLVRSYNGIILNQRAAELFSAWIDDYQNNVSLLKSSFIMLATLSIQNLVGSDDRQVALLFEKYANFQKVIRCDTIDTLKDLYMNLIMDLNDYYSIKNSNKQQLITLIYDHIENHYMEQLSLTNVARTVFLSPSYLSSLIASETGKSFTDIVNEVRIEHAIEMLKDPGRKIADVAYSVGFNEPQYFSIIFKKHTHLTPRDYREFYLKK